MRNFIGRRRLTTSVCFLLFAALGACSGTETESTYKKRQQTTMPNGAPEKVHLIPDDYHLTHVGSLSDERLYWIDVQLSSDRDTRDTQDFVCVYIFNLDGELIAHKITDLGYRSSPLFSASKIIEQELARLPNPRSRNIWVRPFSVEEHGLTFGLVVRDEEDNPVVDAVPGMTLMFYAPWVEGGYDT